MQKSANHNYSPLPEAFLEKTGHLWPASSRLSSFCGDKINLCSNSDDDFDVPEKKTMFSCTSPNEFELEVKKQDANCHELPGSARNLQSKISDGYETVNTSASRVFVSPSKQTSEKSGIVIHIDSEPDSPAKNTRSKHARGNSPGPKETIREADDLVISDLQLGQIFRTLCSRTVRTALKKYTSNSKGFDISTLPNTDLSDTSKGRRLVMGCSLGGKSKKKNIQILKTGNLQALCGEKSKAKAKDSIKIPRKTSSLKVGCCWRIVVKSLPEKQYCQVKELVDIHFNGCSPSPQQHAAVRARRGDTLMHITLPLAVTLRVLFHSHTKSLFNP